MMDEIDLKLLNMLIQCLENDNEIKNGITLKNIAYSTIVAMGEDTAQPLTEYLENNKGIHNRDINQEVANILLDICLVYSNDSPLKIFMEAADTSSEFKLEAIRALGYIGNEESYNLIKKIIKDPNGNVIYQSNAVSSLGDLYPKYGKKEDLELLIDLMEIYSISNDENIIILQNNIIAVTNKILNRGTDVTIGEFIQRRED